jgi:hypothetical protein
MCNINKWIDYFVSHYEQPATQSKLVYLSSNALTLETIYPGNKFLGNNIQGNKDFQHS